MRFPVIISLFLLYSFIQVQGVCDPPEDYVLSGGVEELSKQATVVVYGRIESIGQLNCSSGELEPLEQPLFQGDMFDAIVQLKCIYSDNQAYIKGSERIVVTGFGSEFDCLSSVVEDEEYIIMLQPSTNYSICVEEDDFPLEVYLARYDYASSAVAPATVENLQLVQATKAAKACAEVSVSETGTSVSSASSAVTSQGDPKGAVAESIGVSTLGVSLANTTTASSPNTTKVAVAGSVEGSSSTGTLSDTVSVVKESVPPTSSSVSVSESISVVNASAPSTSTKFATSSSNGNSVVESSSSVVTAVMLPGTLATVDVAPSSNQSVTASQTSVSVAGSDSVSQSTSSASSTASSVETESKPTPIVDKDAEITQVESCEELEKLCAPICDGKLFEASCDMDAGIRAELNCTCIAEPPKCASARAMCETQCLNQGFADFKCEKQNGAFSASCACGATRTKQEEENMQPEIQAEGYCEKVCGQTKADHDFALELLSKQPLSYGFYCECAGLKEVLNIAASLDDLNNKTFNIMNCFLPAQTGACKANLSAYYFDINLNACQEFTYGGCNGNANNFETLEECEEFCGSAVNSALGENILSKFEVDLVEAAIPVCERPKQEGNGRAFIPRFYFDPLTETCQKFIYGGGASNGNNFFTEQECLSACFVLDK